MSATQPPTLPPAPLGLPPPKRSIRALNTRPAILAGAVAVAMSGLVLWTIFSLNDGKQSIADADTNGTQAGATDILANAPTGITIDPYHPSHIPISTRVAATDPSPQSAAPDPDVAPDMTEAAIAARKAAWQAYYQALAERDRTRTEARMKGMQADTEVETDGGRAQPSSAARPDQKEAPKDFFVANASNPATDYLPFTPTDPISPYELKATDQITAKLITQLNSDSPGILKAIVTKNVLDHATGDHILIPQGATLEGVYDTNVSYGQTRVVTAWTRIIYPPPCDQSLDLGAMPGADQSGQAGFHDLTDNHLAQIFTSAILVSVFGAAAQLSQPAGNSFQSYSPVQTAAGAVGQQTSQLGAEFARKGLSIAPTEQVRAGYNFGIFLTKDIAFAKPWIAGVCGSNSAQLASQ
jgi:type IV secretory pathway VirB10-like protein